MTSTIEALRSSMTGSVILPGDEEYETARAIWNADIDRRPAAVARCRTSDDVAAALRFAQQEGLEAPCGAVPTRQAGTRSATAAS
jgi:FAD/FMN-containing dehydrogenase